MGLNFSYFDCQCHSPYHTIRVWLDKDDGSIYVETIAVEDTTFWNRILLVFKLLLGTCSTGVVFNSTIINPKDYDRFRELMYKSEKIMENR